jgi:cell division protein ZapA
MDKKKVTVEIFGDTYALKGDMDIKRVQQLAKMVDEQMRQLSKGCHNLPPTRLAVLVAMNVCDEYLKLQDDYKELLEILKSE